MFPWAADKESFDNSSPTEHIASRVSYGRSAMSWICSTSCCKSCSVDKVSITCRSSGPIPLMNSTAVETDSDMSLTSMPSPLQTSNCLNRSSATIFVCRRDLMLTLEGVLRSSRPIDDAATVTSRDSEDSK